MYSWKINEWTNEWKKNEKLNLKSKDEYKVEKSRINDKKMTWIKKDK